MARDFDFNRKATSRNFKTPTKPSPALIKPALRSSSPKGKGKWSLVLLTVGLVLVGFAIYYQFNQPNKVGTSNSNPTNSLDRIEPSQVKVGVYASGQDLTVCRDLANNISEQGYIANCVGQSLANHAQTEIWSASDYKSEAEKINTAQGLNTTVQTLNTESQYQVIIYTGSN